MLPPSHLRWTGGPWHNARPSLGIHALRSFILWCRVATSWHGLFCNLMAGKKGHSVFKASGEVTIFDHLFNMLVFCLHHQNCSWWFRRSLQILSLLLMCGHVFAKYHMSLCKHAYVPCWRLICMWFDAMVIWNGAAARLHVFSGRSWLEADNCS